MRRRRRWSWRSSWLSPLVVCSAWFLISWGFESDVTMATAISGDSRPGAEPHIIVQNLTMAYGSFVLMRDLNFVVRRGDIFIIMGGSGCGKSTLLRQDRKS